MGSSSLVAAGGELDVLERERLLVQPRLRAHAPVLPHRGVGEALVVADGLAFLVLVLLAEVAAARLVAIERVATQQLGELEEVGDASGLLDPWIEHAGAAAEHP